MAKKEVKKEPEQPHVYEADHTNLFLKDYKRWAKKKNISTLPPKDDPIPADIIIPPEELHGSKDSQKKHAPHHHAVHPKEKRHRFSYWILVAVFIFGVLSTGFVHYLSNPRFIVREVEKTGLQNVTTTSNVMKPVPIDISYYVANADIIKDNVSIKAYLLTETQMVSNNAIKRKFLSDDKGNKIRVTISTLKNMDYLDAVFPAKGKSQKPYIATGQLKQNPVEGLLFYLNNAEPADFEYEEQAVTTVEEKVTTYLVNETIQNPGFGFTLN